MSSISPPPTYHNPVFAHDFPDPFILKHGNAYWAYATGIWHDERCFGILYSPDLVQWEVRAGAMAPLPGNYPCYWAPEVYYHHGVFYLYYSVGDEATMEIRVATARTPDGPFEDSGHRLTTEPFAIDPHIAQDEQGRRYLFYATDFLDHSHIGTGTVRARLADPFTLAEPPIPVTRAQYGWQVYHPNRAEKGGARWHTVEGPFVLHHKGHYYQMFSGGNWQNPSYGVSYALSTTIQTTEEWHQVADGEQTLPILRSFPAQGILGPGHNSVVRGPNNRQWYCVYHRWATDGSGRQMAIDPLDWAGERMVLTGPSTTPRPAPTLPTIMGFDSQAWELHGGAWTLTTDCLLQQQPMGRATATCRLESSSVLLHLLLRGESATAQGSLGIELWSDTHCLFTLQIQPTLAQVVITLADSQEHRSYPLPPTFDFTVATLLKVELNHRQLLLTLDEYQIRWEGWLETVTTHIHLITTDTHGIFSDFALTEGWEDRWEQAETLEALGWHALDTNTPWHIAGGTLNCPLTASASAITKGTPHDAYEVVITLRVLEATMDGQVTIAPIWHPDLPVAEFQLHRSASGWQARWVSAMNRVPIELPPQFDATLFQLFRFRKEEGVLTLEWEGVTLLKTSVLHMPTQLALRATNAAVAIDMVRFTVIPSNAQASASTELSFISS
jgi:arabinan endo-1,5-alpha-L-arabinosidase